ncbi:MAG: hypothetical protein HON04_11005 [Planctomicrobium sp.]|jgi:hypothetical protein|nr:hypothetical protein [Planctomicrobium sp.]
MSDAGTVTFAMFQQPEEAAMAQAYLAENGVESHLLGEVIGTTLNYFGTATGGVRLQGLVVDSERAVELLTALKRETKPKKGRVALSSMQRNR